MLAELLLLLEMLLTLQRLNLDKTSLTFEAAGGTQTVKVTSNVNWTVS